jgi:hypothetical protein
VGEEEGRQPQQQRLVVSATEEKEEEEGEAVFSGPWSTVRARKTWKGALLLGTAGSVVLGATMGLIFGGGAVGGAGGLIGFAVGLLQTSNSVLADSSAFWLTKRGTIRPFGACWRGWWWWGG